MIYADSEDTGRFRSELKSKAEKAIDIFYYACMIFFCGVAAGYAWCWLALN